MALGNQLEVIGPHGEITFHDLILAKGITNIGRHPENDIVIDSPDVALFHAVLDHRQVPFRLMVLAQVDRTTVEGQPPPVNVPVDFCPWETLRIAGYSIILLESRPGGQTGAAPAPSTTRPSVQVEPSSTPPAPATPAALVSAGPPVTTDQPTATATPPAAGIDAVPAGRPGAMAAYGDYRDEVILAELSGREFAADVEQTASFQVTVINGGDIVAAFAVNVAGLEASWVTVSPPQVNLYEGARAAVTVTITPPRLPSSRAGNHPFAVVVSSPNYPGRFTQLGAMLTVGRYQEFSVGELSPRQQTISYRKRTGSVTVPILNKGNYDALFRLQAEDDERGCHFEFQVPGEDVSLARQAEMRLPPGEGYAVPIAIEPLKRRMVAMRSRAYSYTVTVTAAEGDQMPRSLMGQVKSTPLIGRGMVFLIALCLAALGVFLLRPGADLTLEAALAPSASPEPAAPQTYNGRQPGASGVLISNRYGVTPQGSRQGGIRTSRPGDAVVLSYNAARFPQFGANHILNRLNALPLRLALEYKGKDGQWQNIKPLSAVAGLEGSVTHVPPDSGRYRLRASNFISSLAPMLEGVSRELPVYVTPVEPRIDKFGSDRDTIMLGQEITVFWQVTDADALIFSHDGIDETLKDQELAGGQRKLKPEKDTTYMLVASNKSWDQPVKMPLAVKVLLPTPTPVPTPNIVRFDVQPLTIMAGEEVKIGWEVSGADTVSIAPAPGEVPAKGDISDKPLTTTSYRLTAIKTGEGGVQVKSSSGIKEVTVKIPPTPTATPVAPTIELFTSTPKEVVAGDRKPITLTWSIKGQTTNVELASGPDFKLSGLKPAGFISVTVNADTLYILTAYNGELKASAPLEVKANQPTPTVTPTPTMTPSPPPTAPPPTATPFPPPIIAYFKAEPLTAKDTVAYKGRSDSQGGTLLLYDVEAGSSVKFTWDVSGAEKVTLVGYEDQPAQGGSKIIVVVASKVYQLTAENNKGQNKVAAFVQVDVHAPAPPPAPTGVSGVGSATQNLIMWTYDKAYVDKIKGFRIYRAGLNPRTDFSAIQTIADPNVRQWPDPGLNCGKVYYVVAVYTDIITGAEKETSASSTSWISQPCK